MEKLIKNPIVIIGIFCFLLLALITYKLSYAPLIAQDCLRLGSNYRTAQCLELIGQPTPTPVYFTDSNLLTLTNTSMTGNTYYEPNPTLVGELHNGSDRIAKNVMAKVTFYNSNRGVTCDEPADDTEYVMISSIINGGDTQTIKTLVRTNFDTMDAFRWCVSIVGAAENQ